MGHLSRSPSVEYARNRRRLRRDELLAARRCSRAFAASQEVTESEASTSKVIEVLVIEKKAHSIAQSIGDMIKQRAKKQQKMKWTTGQRRQAADVLPRPSHRDVRVLDHRGRRPREGSWLSYLPVVHLEANII